MSRVCTYLNFAADAEEALTAYAAAFGTDMPGVITRMGDMPSDPSAPPLPEAERSLVAHAEMRILAGHVIHATDMLPSMGHELRIGNTTTVMLELDTRAEADRLYGLLAEGGSEATGLTDMPWGAYWGVCLDRFGIRWMFSSEEVAG